MSVLTICNLTITALEDEPVPDLAASKAAVLCDQHFDRALLSTLRLHHWNVNARRVILPALSSTPAFKFSYEYQLPGDCLDVREILDPSTFAFLRQERIIEGRKLLTGIKPPLYMIYGTRMTRDDIDLNAVDPLLEEAIAYKLGTFVGTAITGEANAAQRMQERLDRVLLDAAAADQEDEIVVAPDDFDDWVDVNV